MRRIESVFKQAKSEGRAVLIPYLTAGFPDFPSSLELIGTLVESGADIIELGVPFSDPLADGPTIQKSSQIALSNGIDTDKVFELTKKARRLTEAPFVLMTYFNPVYHYGLKQFVQNAVQAGVDGVIIPDLPFEESGNWLKVAAGKLDTIFLLAPTSSEGRILETIMMSTGFIYCVSLTGVTGVRQALPNYLAEFVWKVKMRTKKPVAVGFGIATAAQAAEVARIADGVIIGSALIDIILDTQSLEAQKKAVQKFIEEIKLSLIRV